MATTKLRDFCVPLHDPELYGLSCEPGLTEQSHKAECDVNSIMAKFRQNGLVDHVLDVAGQYGDYSGAVDFHTALNQVREATDMFMTLPSDLRKEFDNDPGAFLEWTESATEDDLREKGLLPEPTAAPPSEASGDPGAPGAVEAVAPGAVEPAAPGANEGA